MNVEVSVTTDIYPQEISWTIESSNGETVNSDPFFNEETTYETNLCLDSSICHTFTINDSYGDGIIIGGDFNVAVNGAVVLANPSLGFSTLSVEFGQCGVSPTAPTPTAPTPTAPTPTAPSPSCDNPEKSRFSLYLKTDFYGGETSFKVFRRRNNGQFTAQVYAGANFGSEAEYNRGKCLFKSKCYRLEVYDSYGDGLCCSYGEGKFQGSWDGVNIPNEDAVFNSGSVSRSEMFGNC